MTSEVLLDDLRRVVQEISSERFKPYLTEGDAISAARAIHAIATTLAESGVRVDPDKHMLRCSEARALAGFLRSKYRGRAATAYKRRKKELARASIDARADLVNQGSKPTESYVSQRADVDEVYLAAVNEETKTEELSTYFDTLWTSLGDRLEVLIEISRNERAITKGKEEIR